MRALSFFAALVGTLASAQTPATTPAAGPAAPPPTPPQRTIPPQMILEVRELERQFDQALVHDCAPERCTSKGCVYREHLAVDVPPNTTSLPGLGVNEGPGSVPPQLYLTQARCEFTFEKSVATRDVEALARRLEQRLSKGYLKVTVGRQVLDPISPALAESPPPKEDKPVEPPKPPEPQPVTPPEPQEWTAGVALRELWTALLPHFSWMVAVLLLTLATLTIIWALRRLGRESLEEKLMLAELNAAPPEKPAEPEVVASTVEPPSEEARFLSEQQTLWNKRLSEVPLEQDDALVGNLLREWLRNGELPLLAKATLVFGDRLSRAFQADASLTARKAELAQFLKTMKPEQLPADPEFYRALNQNAVAASLLAQPDTEVYRSLQDEFGPAGVVQMVEKLPPRHGALLYALAPLDTQEEVARLLPYPLKLGVAAELLRSTRSSRQERGALFDAVARARDGRPLTETKPVAPTVTDQGHPFEGALALSLLLPQLEAQDRAALFEQVQSGDGWPSWYEDILTPEMVLRLPEAQRADVLLETDVRNLAAWLSLQSPPSRQAVLAALSPSVQAAVHAGQRFENRAHRLELARTGHRQLVAAMKRHLGEGSVTFGQLVT